jgi:hypothetical protein
VEQHAHCRRGAAPGARAQAPHRPPAGREEARATPRGWPEHMEEASAVSVLAVGGAAPSFLRSLRTLLKIFLTNCVTSLSATAAAQARLRSILSKLAAAPYLGSWVTRPGFREAACASPSPPERVAKSPTDPSMGRGLPLPTPLLSALSLQISNVVRHLGVRAAAGRQSGSARRQSAWALPRAHVASANG